MIERMVDLPWGPVRGLALALALWFLMEIVARGIAAWEHREHDRGIRGFYDVFLPASWSDEKNQVLRERILQREQKGD